MTSIRWQILGLLVVVHVAALLAWYTFTWQGLVALYVMYELTGKGITVGYHRYLTHGGFQTYRFMHYVLSLSGMTAFQGIPVEWVAEHRKHHEYSDTKDDPHSPHHGGFFWAHFGWLVTSQSDKTGLYMKYAKDLLKDPFLRAVSHKKVYAVWLLFTFVAIGAVGYGIGGGWMCLSFVVYGIFLRLVVVYHITWAVNSITHLYGSRPHKTRDKSRNNKLVAILAHGEGWHNNHHASPVTANHGHWWWQIDTSKMVIWLLARLGLIWNVRWYNPRTDEVETLYPRSRSGTQLQEVS